MLCLSPAPFLYSTSLRGNKFVWETGYPLRARTFNKRSYYILPFQLCDCQRLNTFISGQSDFWKRRHCQIRMLITMKKEEKKTGMRRNQLSGGVYLVAKHLKTCQKDMIIIWNALSTTFSSNTFVDPWMPMVHQYNCT